MIGHFHDPLTNVRIEFELGKFRLGYKPFSDLSWLILLRDRVSLLVAEEGREFQGLILRRGKRRLLEFCPSARQDRIIIAFLVSCGEKSQVKLGQ